jgi:nicotinate-nucleotide adenylyltransferase
MGGTFDPIHFGHLFIAEEARVQCELERVVFFPNNQPAHRQGKHAFADASTRLEMTQLAVASNSHFEVSRVEVDRVGRSYAFDTLHLFMEQFPGAEFFFIVGADTIGEVPTWYRGAELFELCRFVATTRPGFSWETAKQALTLQQQARVTWLEVPGLLIASRDLRARVARDEPIRYLVPDEVERFVHKRGLYRDN